MPSSLQARLDLMKEKKKTAALEESMSVLSEGKGPSSKPEVNAHDISRQLQSELQQAKDTIEKMTAEAQSKAHAKIEERLVEELVRMSKLHRQLGDATRHVQRNMDMLHSDYGQKQRNMDAFIQSESIRFKTLVDVAEAEKKTLSHRLELVEG
jgi:hypothetical protein